jgi:hypothetical protein
MVEAGQDFAFRDEATKDIFRCGATVQYLDSYFFFEISICARCEINGSHSALANFTNNHISAHSPPKLRMVLRRTRNGKVISALLQRIRRVGLGGQKRFDLMQKIDIISARTADHRASGRRRFVLERFSENRFKLLPSIRVHDLSLLAVTISQLTKVVCLSIAR